MKRSHRGRCSNESEEVELERGEIGRACWSERRLGRTFPVGPRTSFKLQMPGDAIVTEPAETDIDLNHLILNSLRV